MLRLNRPWLQKLRRERSYKHLRLNEAHQLREELERAVNARPADPTTEMKHRLLSFLRQEIDALQGELAVAIPLIQLRTS